MIDITRIMLRFPLGPNKVRDGLASPVVNVKINDKTGYKGKDNEEFVGIWDSGATYTLIPYWRLIKAGYTKLDKGSELPLDMADGKTTIVTKSVKVTKLTISDDNGKSIEFLDHTVRTVDDKKLNFKILIGMDCIGKVESGIGSHPKGGQDTYLFVQSRVRGCIIPAGWIDPHTRNAGLLLESTQDELNEHERQILHFTKITGKMKPTDNPEGYKLLYVDPVDIEAIKKAVDSLTQKNLLVKQPDDTYILTEEGKSIAIQ
jgi:predicted transcriptional regulator